MMLPLSIVIALMLMTTSVYSYAQHNTFQQAAQLSRTDSTITIVANDPRPLLQAVMALRKEFGWAINYEEPPYEQSETITSDNHVLVGGGAFLSRLPLGVTPTPEDRDTAIKALLDAYHHSGNPGHFRSQSYGRDRISIVGQPNDGSLPLLDTLISLPRKDRTVDETIDDICKAVSDARGFSLQVGGFVDNAMLNKHITLGAESLPARALLKQALDYMDIARVWGLDYDPENKTYAIGIMPLIRVEVAASGQKVRHQITTSSLQ